MAADKQERFISALRDGIMLPDIKGSLICWKVVIEVLSFNYDDTTPSGLPQNGNRKLHLESSLSDGPYTNQ